MTATFTRSRLWLFALAGVLLLSFAGSVSGAKFAVNAYHQMNLVSDLPGLALRVDSNLVNPWGMAFSPTGPFWISNAGTGTSTVYDRTGRKFPRTNPLVVTIPPPPGADPGETADPTGMVWNGTGGFQSTINGVTAPAVFIWVTEGGTVAGWNPAWSRSNAFTIVDNSSLDANYKGVEIASFNGNNYLYAADFHNGKIAIFDSLFASVTTVSATATPFVDPNLPAGYAPFNIRNIGGNLYVAYAQQDAEAADEVAGPGLGIVDVYSPDGTFIKRLISNGNLNAPWGMAMAPGNFGVFSNMLLVGNFGDGTINAYDPSTGAYVGTIKDKKGNNIVIDGLWSIQFGSGAGDGGRANALYFTAGIQDESHGLFGQINTIPGGDD